MTDDPRYEIENEEIKKLMKDIAIRIKGVLPPGWGMTLFLFEYMESSCFYFSTAERKDMIKVLKEFIKREEAN